MSASRRLVKDAPRSSEQKHELRDGVQDGDAGTTSSSSEKRGDAARLVFLFLPVFIGCPALITELLLGVLMVGGV